MVYSKKKDFSTINPVIDVFNSYSFQNTKKLASDAFCMRFEIGMQLFCSTYMHSALQFQNYRQPKQRVKTKYNYGLWLRTKYPKWQIV
jgi:hypothetical protein